MSSLASGAANNQISNKNSNVRETDLPASPQVKTPPSRMRTSFIDGPLVKEAAALIHRRKREWLSAPCFHLSRGGGLVTLHAQPRQTCGTYACTASNGYNAILVGSLNFPGPICSWSPGENTWIRSSPLIGSIQPQTIHPVYGWINHVRGNHTRVTISKWDQGNSDWWPGCPYIRDLLWHSSLPAR